MALTDILGNKSRALLLGAALTACGGEPETKYVVIDGQEVEANCEDVFYHIDSCGGFTYALPQKRDGFIPACKKGQSQFPQAWWECMYKECDKSMIGTCDDYLEGLKEDD